MINELKKMLMLLFIAITFIALFSSCHVSSRLQYTSTVDIPQKSKQITTEFKLISSTTYALESPNGLVASEFPFGIVAAIDKNIKNEITEYYIFFAPPIKGLSKDEDDKFIHSMNFSLKSDKIYELIESIDKILLLYSDKFYNSNGLVFEYSIKNEKNFQEKEEVLESKEKLYPEFKLFYKAFNEEKIITINLGSAKINYRDRQYLYNIDVFQLTAFKVNLLEALEYLKSRGLK